MWQGSGATPTVPAQQFWFDINILDIYEWMKLTIFGDDLFSLLEQIGVLVRNSLLYLNKSDSLDAFDAITLHIKDCTSGKLNTRYKWLDPRAKGKGYNRFLKATIIIKRVHIGLLY